MSSTAPYQPASQDPDQTVLLPQEITSWIPTPPPPYSITTSKLLHPIVIPRIDTTSALSAKLPFVRAYSTVLRVNGINEVEFMSFVDMLAVCQAPPVPLQVLDAASHVVGIVPEPVAMGVSAGMGVAAGVGTAATTIIRTRRFMEKVNREFFAPRGLKASICKSEELGRKLGCGVVSVHSIPAESLESANQQPHLRDRYMQALSPYIAPLTFDVPPPSQQRRFLDELSAKAIKRRVEKRENRRKKKAEKAIRKTSRATDHANEAYDSDSSSGSSSIDLGAVRDRKDDVHVDKKIRKIEERAERRMGKASAKDAEKIAEKRERKIEKRERKIERRADKDDKKAAEKSAKSSAKNEKKGEKTRSKEKEKITRMEFLVVENLDFTAQEAGY